MLESARLSDLVRISPTFSAEVNLQRDFYDDPEENRRKLRGYVPTTSCREVLKEIIKGMPNPSRIRAHLITGTYGTGKSHFALILANYFSLPIEDENLQHFLPYWMPNRYWW